MIPHADDFRSFLLRSLCHYLVFEHAVFERAKQEKVRLYAMFDMLLSPKSRLL